MSARPAGHSFRPDIEGLRGVAVLLVLACHCGVPWLAGGFVGVDVFFVLSGYLMTGLLTAEHLRTSRIDLPGFFARRSRRLLPALGIVLVATLLAASCIFPPQQIDFTARAARAVGFYVSNVFFDRTASNYFAPNVEGNPLLHTWSLGLEEQFYLFWPLVISLAGRGPHRARWSVATLGAVAVLSFICCIHATQGTGTFAFYELPARAWEFAVGGLATLIPAACFRNERRAVALGYIGLGVTVGSALSIRGGVAFPGWIALFPVAGTLALLIAGRDAPRRGMSAVLSARGFQYLGARSYSLYLWHWPIIVFATAIVPGITTRGKMLAGAASFVAAAITFTCVERPVRENLRFAAGPHWSLWLIAVSTLFATAGSWALMHHGQQLAINRDFAALTAATTDIADMSPADCWSQGPAGDARICEFGVLNSSETIVLFGDSHAIQWFNAARAAADAERWRLITALRPGCAASDINPHHVPAAYQECNRWRTHAIEKIIAAHPALVVIASYNGATFRPMSGEQLLSSEDLRRGTRSTLERFAHARIPVLVMRDSPIPPFDVPGCIARQKAALLRSDDSCAFSASEALNEGAFSAEKAAAAGLPSVHFLDLSDQICAEGSCPAILHGVIVYRDNNHLTGTFAETLTTTIRSHMRDIIAKTG